MAQHTRIGILPKSPENATGGLLTVGFPLLTSGLSHFLDFLVGFNRPTVNKRLIASPEHAGRVQTRVRGSFLHIRLSVDLNSDFYASFLPTGTCGKVRLCTEFVRRLMRFGSGRAML